MEIEVNWPDRFIWNCMGITLHYITLHYRHFTRHLHLNVTSGASTELCTTGSVCECKQMSFQLLFESCDSFHGIATVGRSDRQVASWNGRVRTRAGERERARERVRGSERVVYTELIVLVLVWNSTCWRKDVCCIFDVF